MRFMNKAVVAYDYARGLRYLLMKLGIKHNWNIYKMSHDHHPTLKELRELI